MKNVKQYYKELGRLLYAIAIADGAVQTEEADKLHQFVMKELAHNERSSDSSGMNQAFYVDFEFDDQLERQEPLDDKVRNFTAFLTKNVEPGDSALLDRSIRLMTSVAYAYSKKKEQLILDHVRQVTGHLANLKSSAH